MAGSAHGIYIYIYLQGQNFTYRINPFSLFVVRFTINPLPRHQRTRALAVSEEKGTWKGVGGSFIFL